MRFSDPVTGTDFIGREKLLDYLRKRIVSLQHGYRHNIALLGPALIGKTSVLLKLLEDLREPKTVSLYLEVRSAETFGNFLNRFLNSFLYQFLKQVQGAAPKEIPLLTERARALIPKTVQEIEFLRASERRLTNTERFKRLLELPAIFHQEFRVFFVLILDEFDKLLELDLSEPFLHLGRQIMVQRQTMYLLASSQTSLAERILKQKLSLLFGQFETIALGPFDSENSYRLLESRWGLEDAPAEFKEYLLSLTGGRPFYLNVLGEELRRVGAFAQPEELFLRLERQLLNAQGILSQVFGNMTEHLRRQDRSGGLLTLLKTIGEGRYTAGALRSALRGRGVGRMLRTKLIRLKEAEFLSENGPFYFLTDPLFAFWLSSCFHRKSDPFSRTPEELSRLFQHEMKERFQRFLASRGKPSGERILCLFESFQGEVVEVDRKKQKLPRFDGMTWVAQATGTYLEARTEEGLWISALFEQMPHEDELFAFLVYCKKNSGKIRKKILIPLGGMDENARLLAKEARLWIWELPQLNLLLRIHGQEAILRKGI